LTSLRELPKPLKPHDLLELFRIYVSQIAAAKFTGKTGVEITWNQGGIAGIEMMQKEIIK